MPRTGITGIIACLMWSVITTVADTSTTAAGNSRFEAPSGHSWRTSKMVGLAIYNQQNEKLGAVDDLLMDTKGDIKEVVISVGGLLGLNTRLFKVPLGKIEFSLQPVATDPSGTSTRADTASKMPPTRTVGTTSTPVPIPSPDPWLPDHAVFDGTVDQLKNYPELQYPEDR